MAGGATVVNEATLAHLSHATHSQIGAHVAWRAQGLGIPFYPIGAYVPYFGLVLLLVVPVFHARRLSPRGVWLLAGTIVIGVFLFEMPWMAADLWHYYGRQSVQPFGWMPVWYAFSSAMLTFVPAVFVARVQDRLGGVKSLLLVPLVIMSSIGGIVAVSWPMYLAMSSFWPDWAQHVAAAAVIGLVALVVWLAIPVVTAPQRAGTEPPATPDSRGNPATALGTSTVLG
ncbi:hypothetical protein OK015_19860 [Mycobacterium sp. Aquia_216]|uniref:hypothetical protein n=1 Tax=Mycobacterium sp. Aquia_216 TaxID=2991729 RepID=UPI00227C60C9|nr:hypothetical protein [Mycobacterium sp. Aquia_216]WAJ43453.1 hypothetical protein OK015_19860 [Mycobacterium sp. Aquia_216]